jgi:hypothetical protein
MKPRNDGSLNVPWMCSEHSLNVHYTFPECPLNVPWVCTERSLNVHWTSRNLPCILAFLLFYPSHFSTSSRPFFVLWNFCAFLHWTFPEYALNVTCLCTDRSPNLPCILAGVFAEKLLFYPSHFSRTSRPSAFVEWNFCAFVTLTGAAEKCWFTEYQKLFIGQVVTITINVADDNYYLVSN